MKKVQSNGNRSSSPERFSTHGFNKILTALKHNYGFLAQIVTKLMHGSTYVIATRRFW